MRTILFFWMLCLLPQWSRAQAYTAYFTGQAADTMARAGGGVCLMGGSREPDGAMRWFLRRAGGGDVLVLRAGGADGYNDYLYHDLGVPVHSVETIVFHEASAAYDPAVHRRIERAEAVWLAGGDQWNYVRYWRGTPIDSLLRDGIRRRNLVIGGTSAGMAVLGGYYFAARHGTVTDSAALADPYDRRVTVDSARFLAPAHLRAVITDTHFAERDRQGRLVAFLARIYADYGAAARAIACDERTAVCIDPGGRATVFTGAGAPNGHAYFVQFGAAADEARPERCSSGQPLAWNCGGRALRVYRLPGAETGAGSFDLTNWTRGHGGDWLYWYVADGSWRETPGEPPPDD